MTRQELIEKLCGFIIDCKNESKVSLARDLLAKLTTSQMTESDAEVALNSLLSDNKYKLVDSVKSRQLRSSIYEFLSGNLSYIRSMKMISSLITHSIIEIEQSSDDKLYKSLRINDLIVILSRSLNNKNISDKDFDKLVEILNLYGYKKKS